MENKLEAIYGATVVGLRREYIVGTEAGENTFEEQECEGVKYYIFCKKQINEYYTKKYVIELEESGGWCGSGYTTASYGQMSICEFYKPVGPITHVPNDKELTIIPREGNWDDGDVITNVFSYSADGGDSYYPGGYIDVNLDLFEELPRAMQSRPRYIFFGDSGLGKSSLAMLLEEEDKVVYETDSSETLPEVIWADIIVLGNKYKFTLEEIKAHMESTDTDNIIMVGFIRP